MLHVESKCVRCNCCRNLSKNINRKKIQQKTTLRAQFKYKRAHQTRRLTKNFFFLVYLMKTKINDLKKKINMIKEEKINEIINDLPQTQQEVIKMCFKASLVKSGTDYVTQITGFCIYHNLYYYTKNPNTWIILLNEMSLSSLVTFNKSTCNSDSLVGSGRFTPEHVTADLDLVICTRFCTLLSKSFHIESLLVVGGITIRVLYRCS
ncbi:Uncharacterized protein FWK35_00017387, partial [Aphis craccivora]